MSHKDTMGKKSKVDVSPNMEAEADLLIKDVQDLGGTKADFEMLKDVDDVKDIIDYQEDIESEPVNRDDIRQFMETIGLAELRRQKKIKEAEAEEEEKRKSRKVKLAVAPEKSECEESVANSDSKTKKKKKEKVQDAEISSTTQSIPVHSKPKAASLTFLQNPSTRRDLLIKSGGPWHNTKFQNDLESFDAPTEEQISRIQQYASNLLEREIELYKKQKESQKGSDSTWLKTVLASGTLQDKIAALTLLAQEAPIHNLPSLDTLISMLKKKGRREALQALDALKDLFKSELLLDRKLKKFDEYPVHRVEDLASGDKDSRDRRLLIWYYEAQLKERYANFIAALQTILHDTISGPKKKALSVIYDLLCSKPEQEKLLLTLIVNKLGDPDYKVASSASNFLTRLVTVHPNMKFVVVLEVERLMYRPNVATKAQYYAVCFLNQLILGQQDSQLAARLITVYFSFFKAFVKREEVDSKMMSALLTGVNRAYPFAKLEREKIVEQVDTLYKIVHIVSFFTGIQALMLLYQVTDASDKSAERYYMALYRKLVDPGLKASSKQTVFLNLLFKSMKKDMSTRRVQAFVKRLLQVCCQQSVPFVCAALYMLSELLRLKPGILMTSKAAEDSEDEEEHFVDAPDDDGEEKGDGEGEKVKEVKLVLQEKGSSTVSSWVHRRNLTDGKETNDYDPQLRNPEYCHADKECVWELKKLGQHFHPTVALWANCLVKGEKIYYEGDPLQDFTLIRFLDRFVYRNPKKQPKDDQHVNRRNRSTRQPVAAVNSEEYLELGEEGVPADEKFFYRYFSKKASSTKRKEDIEEDDRDSNASEISDSEFDDYLDKFELGLTEDRKDDVDFARELKKQKTMKKKDAGSESDSDLDDDLSDEEVEFDDDLEGDFNTDEDEFGSGDDVGFDEEDVEFSDDEEIGAVVSEKLRKGKHSLSKDEDDDLPESLVPKKKRAKGDTSDLFAAATQFADLMDENVGIGLETTGSNAIVNKDKSDAKQLKWEMERERWMNDKGRKGHSKRQKGHSQQRGFGGKGGKHGKRPLNKKKGRK